MDAIRCRYRRLTVLAWTLVSGLLISTSETLATEPLAMVSAAKLSGDASPSVEAVADKAGVVRGHVRDVESGAPLEYTNIVFHYQYEDGRRGSQAGGTMALNGGFFVHRVEPGTYQISFLYIGYEKHIVGDVQIAAGSEVNLDIQMKVKPIVLDQYVVQGDAIKNTAQGILTEKKKSATVSDAISAQEIARGTDSDAAEAVERVTGVSVVDGKYVFVRGLGDRYSATLLNGASLASPEPDKRTIPLDIFPAGLLDNLIIQKTYTPDMDGEFGGGVINIKTLGLVEGRQFSQKFSLGYNENVYNDGYIGYEGGSTDFLARDDGSREFPSGLPPVRLDRSEFSRPELRELKYSFKNQWTPDVRDRTPNFGYGGHFAQGFRLFGRPAGVLASTSLSNSYTSELRQELDYPGSLTDPPQKDYEVQQSARSVLGGVTGALNLQISNGSRLSYNVLHTRSSDDQARIAQGSTDDTDYAREYQLSYVERRLLAHVAQGSHGSILESRLDWTASSTRAERDEPDRRNVLYEEDAEGNLLLSGREQFPFQRVYGESRETDRSFKLDWEFPVPCTLESTFKVGGTYRERLRDSSFRRFGLSCAFGCGDRSENPEGILDEDNPDSMPWTIQELTRPNDSYDASLFVRAGYGMLDLRIPGNVRVNGGVRIEEGEQFVEALSPFVDGTEPEVATLASVDYLPALNVTWSLTPAQNLRASHSRSINRPELRELSPFSAFNYELGYNVTGNPTLQIAKLRSYDLRWEMFPGFGQYVSVSGFYKWIEDPIQRIVLPDVGNRAEVPVNGDTALIRGFEVELKTTLADIVGVLPFAGSPSPFLQNFGLSFNHSRVHSEVNTRSNAYQPDGSEPPEGDTSAVTFVTPLIGQVDRAYNLGLFYDSRGALEASVSLKVFSERLNSLGLGVRPDDYQAGQTFLDVALGWRMTRRIKWKLSAENLTDERFERLEGERITRAYDLGRTFGASLSYSY